MRAVALTAILALVPSAASPCSIKRDTVDSIFPSSGSTGVPLNAEIKYLSTSQTTWSLTDDSGAVVPATEARSGGQLTAIRPMELLRPDRTYTITIALPEDPDAAVTTTFTTGASTDEAPPVAPGRPGVDRVPASIDLLGGRGSCGGGPGRFEFLWAGVSDGETPNTELVVEAFLTSSPDDSAGGPDLVSGCSRMDMDRGCLMRWVPPSSAPVFLKARTVDWAGNFSAFSQPEPVESCGCSSGGPLVGLLGLAIVLRRHFRCAISSSR